MSSEHVQSIMAKKGFNVHRRCKRAFGVAIFVGGDALFNDDSTFYEEV